MAKVFYAKENHIRGLCAVAVEHAHKFLAGPILGLSQVPV